jgi:hypothetical protein
MELIIQFQFILQENPDCFTSEEEPLYQLGRKLSGLRSLPQQGTEPRPCTYKLPLYRPSLTEHLTVTI